MSTNPDSISVLAESEFPKPRKVIRGTGLLCATPTDYPQLKLREDAYLVLTLITPKGDHVLVDLAAETVQALAHSFFEQLGFTVTYREGPAEVPCAEGVRNQ
jgi:hypothetical protein